jgi:hypothetical protein
LVVIIYEQEYGWKIGIFLGSNCIERLLNVQTEKYQKAIRHNINTQQYFERKQIEIYKFKS